MSERTVLISGGSVAGPALAWWLHRYGMRPAIVERSPGLRPGGQAVDLRGPGREVADRMGLIPAIKAAGTGEKGWAFVDGTGRTRAAMSMEGDAPAPDQAPGVGGQRPHRRYVAATGSRRTT
ncbi:MAG: FAD-dependent monooxygenase [Pseudonocardia sp.]|nr:FAD-dependent monooxygenase [Pseudonocardia sp.]